MPATPPHSLSMPPQDLYAKDKDDEVINAVQTVAKDLSLKVEKNENSSEATRYSALQLSQR